MSDKNHSPLASQVNQSLTETNCLSLLEASGKSWKWMLKTSSLKNSSPKKNAQSGRVKKRFIQGEVLLTAVLLVVAIALSCIQRTSAFETEKFDLFQSSSVEHDISQ